MLTRLVTLLGMLLVSPALAQQVTPSFGIDSSGALRNLSVKDLTNNSFVPFGLLDTTTHSMVAATTPVEAYGARGNSNGTTGNGTNDTAAIEACVAGGRVCSLRPGATYRLMSAIDIPSNGGLIGDKTATLYCDPAGINNTLGDVVNRYLQNGACIIVKGPDVNPAAAIANVILKDFKINWGGNTGGRCCQAVEALNAKNMTIDGLEIYNLSTAGIRFASWQGGRIVNNYIHDASNDTGLEYSGIEGDNDKVAGESGDVLISGNRISNMLVSQTGYNNTLTDPLLPDGYQPNAIKLIGGYRIVVTNNQLDHTGQCFDGYVKFSVISNNTTDYCLAFGIALKHSNNNNLIANNTIRNSGSAGIGMSGDPTDTGFNNLITGNVIQNVVEDNWTGFTSTLYDPVVHNDGACIGNGTDTKNNTISNNSCDPGLGALNWRDDSADRNVWNNNIVAVRGVNAEWTVINPTSSLFTSSVVGAQNNLAGYALGDATLLTLGNRGGIADNNAALMEFSSSNQIGVRSVQIGDIDKPTTGAHCFTIRTSLGAPAVERTFTCLGTVIGAPTGGINGDMGVGTLNAQGVYLNGVSLGPPAVASTPAPSLTFGGASTGITTSSASTRSTIRDKQVYFQWQYTMSSKGSATGVALLDGLPVAALNGMSVPCTVTANFMTAGVGDTALSCLILANTTTVAVYKMVAGVSTQLTNADFTNTSGFYISGTYISN